MFPPLKLQCTVRPYMPACRSILLYVLPQRSSSRAALPLSFPEALVCGSADCPEYQGGSGEKNSDGAFLTDCPFALNGASGCATRR